MRRSRTPPRGPSTTSRQRGAARAYSRSSRKAGIYPGNYASLTVDGAHLTLEEGAYSFSSINTTDSQISCAGVCEIRVEDQIWSENSTLGLDHDPWAMTVFVYGQGAAMLDSSTYAQIFVPNGHFVAMRKGEHQGRFVADFVLGGTESYKKHPIFGGTPPTRPDCEAYCDDAVELECGEEAHLADHEACVERCEEWVFDADCATQARWFLSCFAQSAGDLYCDDDVPMREYCEAEWSELTTCHDVCAAIDDNNDCTEDLCDCLPGDCNGGVHVPTDQGTNCSDGNPCTLAGQCDAQGTCVPGPAVPINTPCTEDLCTSADYCDGSGTCLIGAGTPPTLDDNNPCTIDTCDPATGVVTHTPVPPGTPCDGDDDVCNGVDTCDAYAVCQPGAPPSIDDGNPCTSDTCDPQTGVVHTPTPGVSCEDGDFCNGAELCDAVGHCASGTPQQFEDSDPLTIDVCDPSTGLVTHYPISPGGGSFFEDVRYLFEDLDPVDGIDPPQQGVTATINPEQLAVVRGQVFDHNMSALPGVMVRILQHDPTPGAPSYGHVLTDSQGWFQIAVNGGGPVTVVYEKSGHPPVQRLEHTDWRDYAMAPDVVLTPLSESATQVVLDGSAQVPQVVRGPVVTDPVGTRQATVIFEPGTEAFLEFDDAPAQPAGTLTIRATEFTVGERGPDAMPGELPMASAYTYAIDLRADEAEAAGAHQVSFSKAAAYYVENFYEWPVGGGVPLGYYDFKTARWVSDQTGVVLEYLGDTDEDGVAEIDLTGDGVADEGALLDAFGITLHERMALVSLYAPGQTLWRVVMEHFSTVDLNALLDLPEGSCSPGTGTCSVPSVSANTDAADPCLTAGSEIECENQSVGHRVPVAGTPYELVYRSNRVEGYTALNQLRIPLTGPDGIPFETNDIVVSISVAGRSFWYRYRCRPLPEEPPPFTPDPECDPNSEMVFDAWDGRDAYGRLLSGAQVATVRVGYAYLVLREIPRCFTNNPPQAVLCGILEMEAASFGQWSQGGVLNAGSTYYFDWWNVVLWGDRVRVPIGNRRQETMQLGGFGLNAVHYYDRVAGVFHHGDGSRRRVGAIEWTLEVLTGKWPSGGTVAEGGLALESVRTRKDGVEVGPDGTVYSAEGGSSGQGFIRRTLPDGTFDYLVGGTPSGPLPAGFSGDGGPAKSAQLSGPLDVARAKDGSFYISDSGNHRIRRVSPDGIIETVAGTGTQGHSPNGTPGPLAHISYPRGITVSADGSVYFVDNGLAAGTGRVKRIAPDGRVWTVAGGGTLGYTNVRCLTECEAPCTADNPNPDLMCRSVAGTEMALFGPRGVAVDAAGGVLFSTLLNNPYVWRIDASGNVQRFAGTGAAQDGADGAHRLATPIAHPGGLAIGPDGVVYVAHGGSGAAHSRIRAIQPDGHVVTVAGAGNGGCGSSSPCGIGGPATWADMVYASDVAVDPNGRLVIADSSVGLLYRTETHADVQVSSSSIFVPSEDARLLHEFDLGGRHLRTKDAVLGIDLLTMQYDATGRLQSLTDLDGRVTTLDYQNKLPEKVTGPFGHETSLTTDATGRLVAVTDQLGGTHTFTYDSPLPGLVTGYRSPAWHATHPPTTEQKTYVFDVGSGRLTGAGGPMAWSKSFVRTGTETDWTVEMTDPVSLLTSYQTTNSDKEQSRVVITPTGFSSSTVVAHDGTSSQVMLLDDTSITTTHTPDERFGMMAPVSAVTIETNGLARDMSTSRSATVSVTDPFSIDTITESTTIEGRTSSWTVDRTVSPATATYTSAANRSVTSTLTPEGRLATLVLPEQEPITFVYETSGVNKGRLLEVKQGTGALERSYVLHYNATGNLWKIEDALDQATYLQYDGKGRLTKTIFPDAAEVRFAYDLNDNLLALAQPGSPGTYTDDDVHRFFYDGHDRAIQYDPPLVPNLTSDTIDWHRRADLSLDLVDFAPQGLAPQLDPSYDSATGQLTSLGISGGGTLTFGYYALGDSAKQDTKLESIASSLDGITLGYVYGGALVTEETMTGPVSGAVGWEYDSDFRVQKESINGDTDLDVDYAYADGDGLMTAAGAMAIARRPQTGAVETTTLGTTTTTYGVSAFGELSEIEVEVGQTLKYDVTYARDKLGRVECKSETVDVVTTHVRYAYDAAGRLHQVFTGSSDCCAVAPSPCTTLVATYGYDANGNRTSYDDAVTSVVGTYDEQDRITSYGSTTYTFNAMGQLATRTNATTTTYTYDAAGSLRQVALPGATIDYEIDGRGRRVGKRVGGLLQKGWLYGDDLNPIAELAADGTTVTKRFVYAHVPHVPSHMIDVATGDAYLFVTDQLGSVRLVVNATTGAIAQEIGYDAWGQATLLQGTWDVQPFAFAGGLYDPDTALYRFGARDYDPEIGRWTAKDPVLFRGEQSNLYEYVRGGPTNWVDPSGRWVQFVVGGVGGAAFGVVGYALSAAMTGQPVTARGIGGAAVGGAVGGLGMATGIGLVAALAGGASSAISDVVGGREVSLFGIGLGAALGGAFAPSKQALREAHSLASIWSQRMEQAAIQLTKEALARELANPKPALTQACLQAYLSAAAEGPSE